MSEETVCRLSIVISFVLMIALLVVCDQREELKVQAVKRRYAEWVVGDRGDVVFKWKEAKP